MEEDLHPWTNSTANRGRRSSPVDKLNYTEGFTPVDKLKHTIWRKIYTCGKTQLLRKIYTRGQTQPHRRIYTRGQVQPHRSTPMDKLNCKPWKRIYTHGQTQWHRRIYTHGQTQLHHMEEDLHPQWEQGYPSSLWRVQDQSLSWWTLSNLVWSELLDFWLSTPVDFLLCGEGFSAQAGGDWVVTWRSKERPAHLS